MNVPTTYRKPHPCVTWFEEDTDTGDEAKRIVEMNCPGEYSYMRAERIA